MILGVFSWDTLGPLGPWVYETLWCHCEIIEHHIEKKKCVTQRFPCPFIWYIPWYSFSLRATSNWVLTMKVKVNINNVGFKCWEVVLHSVLLDPYYFYTTYLTGYIFVLKRSNWWLNLIELLVKNKQGSKQNFVSLQVFLWHTTVHHVLWWITITLCLLSCSPGRCSLWAPLLGNTPDFLFYYYYFFNVCVESCLWPSTIIFNY